MEKEKRYIDTRFSADVLHAAATSFGGIFERDNAETKPFMILHVQHEDCSWKYDNLTEFLADYRRYQRSAWMRLWGRRGYEVTVRVAPRETEVAVEAPSRQDIETVFDVFEKHLAASSLSPIPSVAPSEVGPVVFIGHGRSLLWRDLKDHLQDKHDIEIVAYESGARAGHTIRDVLEEMVRRSSFALLVLTGEDEQPDGTLRARQNVIHEAGLFQGRLGFSRAIILLEDGTDAFSNIDGVQQVRFSRGNIREVFGDVVATLRREFGPGPG